MPTFNADLPKTGQLQQCRFWLYCLYSTGIYRLKLIAAISCYLLLTTGLNKKCGIRKRKTAQVQLAVHPNHNGWWMKWTGQLVWRLSLLVQLLQNEVDVACLHEHRCLKKRRFSGMWRIQAGSSMSGSGVSKYGCVLSNSGTSGNTSVGWREPRNFRHLRGKEKIKTANQVIYAQLL